MSAKGLGAGRARPAARGLVLGPAERRREQLVRLLLGTAAWVTVLTTVAVVFVLARETLAFFRDPLVSVVEFFTSDTWTPLFVDKHFGIAPLLSGTLLVTLIAMLVGVPLGIGSAIYLSEFAAPAVRRRLQGALELLAGIPTVVLGYFALLFVTPWLQSFIPGLKLFNALSAGLVMGFMIMPVISSLSADAMQAVPVALREAGYGLGASKLDVTLKVVVPAALSGILAAVILAFSRAVGETMIVTLAAGQRPLLTLDPRETIATMTSFIVQAATGDQPAGSLAVRSLYAVAATLFVITFLLNLATQALVRRFGERYE
ncbi:MAG: phosphate ABC transporter permease subunit PstC [Trueperaceae bacterium]|jgi:phosphate transport system permease protein|nr:phosphate ABC transporter permease subunit PstC [Truepera sp.]